MGLDPYQAEVAKVALSAAAEAGFALAGGNALVVHGLVDRPTQDVDLFSPAPGAAGAVVMPVRRALEKAGYRVEVLRSAQDNAGEYVQLTVSRDNQTVLVELARDWRQHPPVNVDIGPVLHVDDAVGSKVTAMVGRGLPRDFIDIAAALERYSREELMSLAFARDPGLRVVDFITAVGALDGIPTEAFAPYGLHDEDVAALRGRFADWPREPLSDATDERAHGIARPSSWRPSRTIGASPPATEPPAPGP